MINAEPNKKMIMVVDDEPSLVSMLEEVMRLAGYDCRGFQSAAEGLEEFRRHPDDYRVVITDLTMPGMKGDDLARRILGLNPACTVILSTGYHAENLDGRTDDFIVLQKPYQIDRLLKFIAEKMD